MSAETPKIEKYEAPHEIKAKLSSLADCFQGFEQQLQQKKETKKE